MDSSTKFRIARAANIENSNASNIGEDVLIIDEGGKGMYIGTNTTMPSKNIAVGPNQLKTINGEIKALGGSFKYNNSADISYYRQEEVYPNIRPIDYDE